MISLHPGTFAVFCIKCFGVKQRQSMHSVNTCSTNHVLTERTEAARKNKYLRTGLRLDRQFYSADVSFYCKCKNE